MVKYIITFILFAFLLTACAVKCYQFAPTPSGFLTLNECTGQINFVPVHEILNGNKQ